MRQTIRRLAFLCLAMVSLGAISMQSAQAAATDKFPMRPITIVVPYSAGGGTDTLARNLARVWQEHWGQPVVVINRTGADGIIGSEYVKNQPADGYTVLIQVNQALFYPYTVPSANLDILRDFQMVSKLQQNAMIFGVASNSPDKTFGDFIARCKKSPNPCSFGAATRHGEIMARQIGDLTGLSNMVVANYKGTSPMMVDALGGHISMGMPSLVVALPQVKGGEFRALATGATARLPELPDVPTLKEEGLNMSAMTWYGIMVRKGTPESVVNALSDAVRLASDDKKLRTSMETEGAIPVFSSPADFDADVHAEAAAVRPLLEKYLTPVGK